MRCSSHSRIFSGKKGAQGGSWRSREQASSGWRQTGLCEALGLRKWRAGTGCWSRVALTPRLSPPQGEGVQQLREALKILAERVLILEHMIGIHDPQATPEGGSGQDAALRANLKMKRGGPPPDGSLAALLGPDPGQRSAGRTSGGK
uniref:Collagen type XXVI alpha 1 chain n=1 Tax=Bos indicus x Bos taurus TaxID=30522 RepID=A0A4W2BLC1_BOBOX